MSKKTVSSVEELAALWLEARADTRPGKPMEEVMSRLIRKYKAMAKAAGNSGSASRARGGDRRG